MKKIISVILISLLFCNQAFATTWYACTANGNWSSAAAWTSVMADQGTCVASLGTPVAGDTAILNSSSGNITLTSNAACATLAETGYAGTLALSTFAITTTAGITLGGTLTSSGATNNSFIINGSQIITTNSITVPGNVGINGTLTLTTSDAVTISGTLYNSSGSPTFSGANNITVAKFSPNLGTWTFPATQTLNVTTAMQISGQSISSTAPTITIKSDTSSSAFNINYTGTITNDNVSNTAFTDIAATGNTIYDYNAGTLTRTSNISPKNATNFGGSNGYVY